MDVHRPPGRIPGRRPSSLDVRSFRNDDRTGLECRPGVRHDHDEKGEEVQQEPEKNVKRLFRSILHGVPAIPIEIERGRLEQEQDAVKDEGGEKDIGQIIHEFGIEPDQQEQQDSAEECGRRVGGGQQFRKLFGQLVVPLLAAFPTDDFAEPGEDGHAEDETRQQQMELGDDPHDVAAADARNVAVLYRTGRRPLRREAECGHGQQARCKHPRWKPSPLTAKSPEQSL